VSGALFGIEVLYLGRIEYGVLFPCLMAGIVAHLVCGGSAPVPALHADIEHFAPAPLLLLTLALGGAFGLIALLLIETMRTAEKAFHRWAAHPYLLAAGGGLALAVIYSVFGTAYAGLGTDVIQSALAGTAQVFVLGFAVKILSTSLTLETGGSGGIVTPLFFIGATSGYALARLTGLPSGMFAAFGFVAVLAAAANTPIAAAVMGMELLPTQLGVYAALCAGTAFLIVGHRSVYASQKIGLSKSAGLEVPLDVAIGDVDPSLLRIRKGSLTERVHRLGRRSPPPEA
jgi:H+/Cl- antiporter ClcA